MSYSALRATDADFKRAGDDLHDLAVAIAASYVGNWEDMIAMQTRVTTCSLDDKAARSVLNMALGSPTLEMLWGARIRGVLRSSRGLLHEPTKPAKQHDVVVPIREVTRSYRVDAPVRFHMRYAMADVKQAVAHIPDPARSYIGWETREFHPQTDEHFADRVAVLHGWWYCGKSSQSRQPNGYGRDIIMFDDVPEGRRTCALCLEVEAEGGPKPRRYEFRRPTWTNER